MKTPDPKADAPRQGQTPDPNAGAPRPARRSSDDERKPTMDTPPPGQPRAKPSFDKGVAAANRDAASGQRPGQGDSAAVHAEGTADTSEAERVKHQKPVDDAGSTG